MQIYNAHKNRQSLGACQCIVYVFMTTPLIGTGGIQQSSCARASMRSGVDFSPFMYVS